jgi:DNA-binding transcriptional LysR family regulator
LLPAALTAVGEIEGAAAQISDIGEKARQTLRVAATPLVSSNLLPTVCRSFRIRHPEVTIRLVDCDLKQVHTLVETGEVDFGLGFFFQAARGIERSLLYSFQLMRAGGTGTMPWSELDDTPLIGLPPDNPIQQLVETHLAKIGRSNEDRLTFSHFDTLIAMVAAGMGTAIIPAFAMLACRRHRVRTDLLTDPEVTLGFFRITKRGRGKADSMTDFTDTLTSLLPSLVQA